jgi:hypothetical protein
MRRSSSWLPFALVAKFAESKVLPAELDRGVAEASFKQRCRCLETAHPRQRSSQVSSPGAALIGNESCNEPADNTLEIIFNYRVGLRPSVVFTVKWSRSLRK